MPETSETDILAFLAEFKRLVSIGDFIIIDRLKNRQALLELNITANQRKDYLLQLKKSRYSAGPVQDEKLGGEVWIFGKNISGNEVYIKIAVNTWNGRKAYCISFHIAERPFTYPFRC